MHIWLLSFNIKYYLCASKFAYDYCHANYINENIMPKALEIYKI